MNIVQRAAHRWQSAFQKTLEYRFFSIAATSLVLLVSLAMVYQAFQSSNGFIDPQPIEITSTGPIIVAREPDKTNDGNVLGASDALGPSSSADTSGAALSSVPSPSTQSGQSQPITGNSVPASDKPTSPPATPSDPVSKCNPDGVLDHLVDQVGGVLHTLLPPVQLTSTSPCP